MRGSSNCPFSIEAAYDFSVVRSMPFDAPGLNTGGAGGFRNVNRELGKGILGRGDASATDLPSRSK